MSAANSNSNRFMSSPSSSPSKINEDKFQVCLYLKCSAGVYPRLSLSVPSQDNAVKRSVGLISDTSLQRSTESPACVTLTTSPVSTEESWYL